MPVSERHYDSRSNLNPQPSPRLVVIALGGNALLKRGEPLEADVQRDNVARAAAGVAAVARGHRVVVTHGNGPQVGLLAMQAEAYSKVPPYPLDVLGAESEGMIDKDLAAALLARQLVADALLLLTDVDAVYLKSGYPRTPWRLSHR